METVTAASSNSSAPSATPPGPASGTSSPPASSTQSASSPSSTATAPAPTPPPKKPGPDPEKVKEILAHREARKGPRASAAESPPTGSSSGSATASGGDAAAPTTESSKSSSGADEGGDPELAKRLARIATQEDKARAILKEAEGAKTELVEYRAWKESRGKDPVAAALHGLTDQQRDALYWQLNDHVLKSDPAAPKDPAEEARRVAREEWDKLNREKGEQESKQLATRMEEHRSFYVNETAKAFQADPAKWPAIRARGVPAGDIVSHVEAEFKRTGELLDAAAVLDHFQRKFEADIEAAGYTRQKVEAQPGGEKPRNGTTTVTQEWSSGAGPASAADDRSKSRRQSSEEIKRKHFKR